ncbi:hypothetical protein ACOSQ3_004688 [Xanthoceras sorbifolium]
MSSDTKTGHDNKDTYFKPSCLIPPWRQHLILGRSDFVSVPDTKLSTPPSEVAVDFNIRREVGCVLHAIDEWEVDGDLPHGLHLKTSLGELFAKVVVSRKLSHRNPDFSSSTDIGPSIMDTIMSTFA